MLQDVYIVLEHQFCLSLCRTSNRPSTPSTSMCDGGGRNRPTPTALRRNYPYLTKQSFRSKILDKDVRYSSEDENHRSPAVISATKDPPSGSMVNRIQLCLPRPALGTCECRKILDLRGFVDATVTEARVSGTEAN